MILFVPSSVFALETYVGIKIDRLEDAPGSSCVGEFNTTVDPAQQGRIRALSSIVGPEYPNQYPFNFELTYASNGSVIWSGNSTQDTDYGINETIFLPESTNLTIGEDYILDFTFNAIRVYISVPSSYEGETWKSTDNNYWSIGNRGISCSGGGGQTYINSPTESCQVSSVSNTGCTFDSKVLFSSKRNISLTYTTSVGTEKFISSSNTFNMNDEYLDINDPGNGNMQLGFTFE